ncbi:hypothetical protein LZ496_01080 [Sphingomonas sp. NSE70-1]|uniref:Hpr(Ser) kinase/phosphatase n=1 Tax=Sphingomonas caseinilyticus TaxID=2908205 RepID=A0ABT0RQV6_9SPHN|nr:hypothetical protein [Sphingomonas caseinilyticus]MCL6697384.1 hypothetical protein [Sphingomonas caseinilyticus]
MARSPAELLLERETRARYGPVPIGLCDEALQPMSWQMGEEAFLLRAEGDHYFYYRRGEGLTIQQGIAADASEETLWLNGSVYAAIASMNGLVPIHASAVAHEGEVFAFTGPAGAGKSTLAAALGRHGFSMFCDDTLVLDLSDPLRLVCLPGHKRLKLCPDAFALAGAIQEEKVSATYDKYYASPAGGMIETVMPLAELIFLEDGPDPAVSRIAGAERFVRLDDDHQTAYLFEAARRFDRAGLFAHRARLARQMAMSRFVRPRDASRFDEGIAMVADYIRNRGQLSA